MSQRQSQRQIQCSNSTVFAGNAIDIMFTNGHANFRSPTVYYRQRFSHSLHSVYRTYNILPESHALTRCQHSRCCCLVRKRGFNGGYWIGNNNTETHKFCLRKESDMNSHLSFSFHCTFTSYYIWRPFEIGLYTFNGRKLSVFDTPAQAYVQRFVAILLEFLALMCENYHLC